MNNTFAPFTDPAGRHLILTANDGRQYLVPQQTLSTQFQAPVLNQFYLQQQFSHQQYSQMLVYHHLQQQQQQQHQHQHDFDHLPSHLRDTSVDVLQTSVIGPVSELAPHELSHRFSPQPTPVDLQLEEPSLLMHQSQDQELPTSIQKSRTDNARDKPATENRSVQARLRAAKREKCIMHYIDGRLIIETSLPFSGKKAKRRKEQRKLQSPQQQISSQEEEEQQPLSEQRESRQQSDVRTHQSQMWSPPPLEPLVYSEPPDPARVRLEMPTWSIEDVVKFIELHEDIRQYSAKFAEDEVDGRALMLMIDRSSSLPILTSMFKHGPAIKIEAALSRYKLNEP